MTSRARGEMTTGPLFGDRFVLVGVVWLCWWIGNSWDRTPGYYHMLSQKQSQKTRVWKTRGSPTRESSPYMGIHIIPDTWECTSMLPGGSPEEEFQTFFRENTCETRFRHKCQQSASDVCQRVEKPPDELCWSHIKKVGIFFL